MMTTQDTGRNTGKLDEDTGKKDDETTGHGQEYGKAG